MLNLRVDDFDIKNEAITVRGEGWNVTYLDVVSCDVKILGRYSYCEHEKLKPKDFVMQSNMDKKMHRAQVYRIVNNIAVKAGLNIDHRNSHLQAQ